MGTPEGYLRIGELSRRVGVGHDTLRAWERRYGLLRPHRTEGGFRLYGDADVARVRAMVALVRDGVAPAQAALVVLEGEPDALPSDPVAALREAVEGFHEARAHGLLDALLERLEPDAAVGGVLMPYLRDLGERWADGAATIAQEHFASTLVRARLLQHGRDWRTDGPHALLACPPGEWHDLPLVALALLLRRRGWRVTLLGADTPVHTVHEAARALGPRVCVLGGILPDPMREAAREIRLLAAAVPTVLAGPGASAALARDTGGHLEAGDPVAAARRLTATWAND